MSAESELHDALNADASLTAVVDTRIYPDFLAQEITLPAIVYQRDKTEYVTTIHSGAVLDTHVVLEVYCLATTRIGAEAVADLVEDAIATSFLPVERRPEFNEEKLTFMTIVSVAVWPA
jgi:uncharacterized protein DUF3168